MTQYHRVPLRPGEAIRHWRLSEIRAERFDLPAVPMAGGMDAMFFVASQKNFIPHEYPCRTALAARFRGEAAPAVPALPLTRWWFGQSETVDLSGFWYRPTRLAAYACTEIVTAEGGAARFRLTTCGGARLRVNGAEAGWIAGYRRNFEESAALAAELPPGSATVEVWFDDLAERDTRFLFRLDYLEGPAATLCVPVPVEAGRAAALERLVAGMRFERPSVRQGAVRLMLPEPAPPGLALEAVATVESIGAAAHAFRRQVPEDGTAVEIASVRDLPAGFRHWRLRLADGGLALEQRLGLEVIDLAALPPAPASPRARADAAIARAADTGEPDAVTALARLAEDRGGPATDAMIAACLPAIADCFDCADFLLVPLLWGRMRWCDRIGEAVRARLDETILGFRYWLDEPGDDVMWFFSENHALLFHTAAYLAGTLFPDSAFTRSGRLGTEQARLGRQRLLGWFTHFEACELGEWNSGPYIPLDLKGLCTLFACAPDADIRSRAGAAIGRLVEILARSSHHGLLTASQGRSYEHSLRAVRSSELSGIARLLWGRGHGGSHAHALPLLALCLRDHGLAVPPALEEIAFFAGPGSLEWCYRQGENGLAALYHCRTADWAMGSVAGYRPGGWGYQETVLQLRLGAHPEAQIWINHPGELAPSGSGRPSFWGGNGTIPRLHQYRGLAVLDFALAPELPGFTHAWLPDVEFDEVVHEENRVLVRAGSGLALLQGSAAFERVTAGPTAGCELRLPGRCARWLVRLSDLSREGSLAGFGARMAGLAVERGAGDALVLSDPDYGVVHCAADGVVAAQGRRLDPAAWTLQGMTSRLPA